MAINDNIYDTSKYCIVYIMNHVGGMAFSHLKLCAQNNTAKPWKNFDKMFGYLELVFSDLNKQKNTENNFWALCQGEKYFYNFFAEFQWLSMELDQNKATLINNLTSKLFVKMRQQLSFGDKSPTNLFKYAVCCQHVYQDLKDITRVIAASERYKKKCAILATFNKATTTTTLTKKVSISTTTIQTTSFANPNLTSYLSCQLTFSERKQLIREEKCFTCKKQRHIILHC